MIKRFLSLLPLLAFFQLSSLQASPENVRTESPDFSVEFYASALFLKPSSSHLHYAVEAIPLPLPSPNWNVFDIHPKYHAAFDIGFKAIIHEKDTAFMANWQRFRSSRCAAENVGSNNMIGPFFEIGPDAALYTLADGKVRFAFDEANIDYGLLVDCGPDLEATLFGGIGIVRIEECLTSHFSNVAGTVARTINVPSTFVGAGPQFGFESSYYLTRSFSFAGKANISLLCGRLKNHTTYLALSPALAELDITPPNKQRTCVDTRFGVVPGIEEKMGITYSRTLRDDYFMDITVGYQVQLFVNALQSVDMGSEVVTPPVAPDTVGVFARTFQRTMSNFALAGPYLTFDFAF